MRSRDIPHSQEEEPSTPSSGSRDGDGREALSDGQVDFRSRTAGRAEDMPLSETSTHREEDTDKEGDALRAQERHLAPGGVPSTSRDSAHLHPPREGADESDLRSRRGGDRIHLPANDPPRANPVIDPRYSGYPRPRDGHADKDTSAQQSPQPRAAMMDPTRAMEDTSRVRFDNDQRRPTDAMTRSIQDGRVPRSSSMAPGVAHAGSTVEAPAPVLEGLPLPGQNSGDYRFKLTVRQHPKQGRQCGFGVKDKRPLDPLPIVQLQIYGPDGKIDEEAHNSPNLLMQVALSRVDPATGHNQESTLVGQPSDAVFPWTRMLEGKLAASAHVVRDLDGSKACFFVFTDLSVRLEGVFRLRFQLIALGPPTSAEGSGSNVVGEAETEGFTIYSPRRFPGMTESTELAKALARQGVQIPIRNDVRRRQD